MTAPALVLTEYHIELLRSLLKGPKRMDIGKSPVPAIAAAWALAAEYLVSISDGDLVTLTPEGRNAIATWKPGTFQGDTKSAVARARGTKMDQPRRERAGSNVDLPLAEEIDNDLTRWSHAIDDALAQSQKVVDEIPYLEEAFETAWAQQYLEALKETDAVSGRENYARIKTIKQKVALEAAKGIKARHQVVLDARRAQLSAAQSRVKLYTAQLNIDTRGGD